MVTATDTKKIQDVHQSVNAQEDKANQKTNEAKELNNNNNKDDTANPPVKRKRGRPPKLNGKPKPMIDPSLPKRKRGRPKKVVA